MGPNSRGRSGRGGVEPSLGDPVVYAVYERGNEYAAGVPFERVVQVVRNRHCVGRPEAVREVQARIADGKLARVGADRLRLPSAER